MTIQKLDIVVLDGHRHDVIHHNGGEPFVPADHGLRPTWSSSACWRGYWCAYDVRDGRIILDALHVNHQDSVPASQLKRPPSLNGVDAQRSTEPYITRWQYDNVGLWLRYTGALRIGREPYREPRSAQHVVPVARFGKVLELAFEDGTLTSVQDAIEPERQ